MSTHLQELFYLGGKTALVTGSSRGLGLQLAEALGEAGASLFLTSRKAAALKEAADCLRQKGVPAKFEAGHATDPASIARICARALESLGHIDILVNNAGATIEEWFGSTPLLVSSETGSMGRFTNRDTPASGRQTGVYSGQFSVDSNYR